ncbi:MAG: DUF4215 domain-containing protein [Myxococcota bacterium]
MAPVDGDGTTSGGDESTGTPTPDESTGADETTGAPMPVCGDGTVDEGEECDDGEANADNAACKSDCVAATCGDGLVYEGIEDCDDGNDDDTDGCSNSCEIVAACGNGEVDEGEECDDGSDNGPNGACSDECTAAVCGDGVTQSDVEQCDDANEDNNDACTELCAPPTCGDGFAQTVNSELCDDGDDEEGDECNADCTTAGLWTDTYNGPANSNDTIYGTASDSDGNVIVVGESLVTGEGDNIWVRKYTAAGAVDWTQTYHGVTSDIGYAVAVNGADQIFVAGSSFTLDDGRDAWIRRYSDTGGTAWTQTYNGNANENDEALGIAVDPSGNVVVAGYTTTATAGSDIWVRKYNSSGNVQWTRTASGTGNEDDEGHAIATDSDGNVIVTGYAWAGGASRDVWVRKYDAAGNVDWTETFGGGEGNDEGNGVAADSAGNVVVVGYVTTASNGRDVWVRKYSAAGAEQWTQTYDAPQNANDTGRGVTIDGNDEIVVAASINRGTQSDNIWVRKYDVDGNELWTSTYNSDAFGSDVGHAVSVDPEGNIAVGGFETRSDLGQSRNAWVRRILQ